MNRVESELFDLAIHAKKAMHNPTGWQIGNGANYELIKLAHHSHFVNHTQETGLTVLGFPVVLDRSLPPNKVVFKAGENTIGTIEI